MEENPFSRKDLVALGIAALLVFAASLTTGVPEQTSAAQALAKRCEENIRVGGIDITKPADPACKMACEEQDKTGKENPACVCGKETSNAQGVPNCQNPNLGGKCKMTLPSCSSVKKPMLPKKMMMMMPMMMGKPPMLPMIPMPMPKMMMMMPMPMPMPCLDPTQLANLGENAQRQCGDQPKTADPLDDLFDLPTTTATTTEEEEEKGAFGKLTDFLFGSRDDDEDEGPATVVIPVSVSNINDGTTEEITTLMPNQNSASPFNLFDTADRTAVFAGDTFVRPTQNTIQTSEPTPAGIQAAVQSAAGFAQAVAQGVFGGVGQVSSAVIQAANNVLNFLSGGVIQI